MTIGDTKGGSLLARWPKRDRVWRRVVLSIAVGLVGLIIVAALVTPQEPRYGGKPVSYWLEELSGDDPDAASEAILAIGAPAIPYLLNAIQTKVPKSSSPFLEKMSGLPLVGRLADKLSEQRSRREQIPDAAAEVLVSLRKHVNQFVPALVRIYQDPKRSEDVIERAAEVLAVLGPDAAASMPSYLAHLSGTDLRHKHLTVSILSAIGPSANAAVPLLTNQFNGDDPYDLSVAEALWSITQRTNDCARVCLRILQSRSRLSHEDLTIHALKLLDQIGPAAKEAIPVLRELFLKARPTIRFPAEQALRSIDPPTLDGLNGEANQIARQRVERIVASLGAQSIWARTPERTNFFHALPTIAALGPEAKVATARLVELLTATPLISSAIEENHYRVRIPFQAALTLGQIGDGSEFVVSALTSRLEMTNPMVAKACCEALGKLGPPARAAVPALREMLKAEGDSLRLAAAMALVQIEPDARATVVPVLRELEGVQDLRIRDAVKMARWKIEREGLPPLEHLHSDSLSDLYVKIMMLDWLGPAAKAALPQLIGIVMTNRLSSFRLQAADAIRRIDPATYEKLRLPGSLGLPENPED